MVSKTQLSQARRRTGQLPGIITMKAPWPAPGACVLREAADRVFGSLLASWAWKSPADGSSIRSPCFPTRGNTLSDAVALGLRRLRFPLGARRATREKTFGFKRFEVLAAFGNGLTLAILSVLIAAQALGALGNPTRRGAIHVGRGLPGPSCQSHRGVVAPSRGARKDAQRGKRLQACPQRFGRFPGGGRIYKVAVPICHCRFGVMHWRQPHSL